MLSDRRIRLIHEQAERKTQAFVTKLRLRGIAVDKAKESEIFGWYVRDITKLVSKSRRNK